MKYKNRLIIPTLLSTSLLASTMVASADEINQEEKTYEQNLEIYYEEDGEVDNLADDDTDESDESEEIIEEDDTEESLESNEERTPEDEESEVDETTAVEEDAEGLELAESESTETSEEESAENTNTSSENETLADQESEATSETVTESLSQEESNPESVEETDTTEESADPTVEESAEENIESTTVNETVEGEVAEEASETVETETTSEELTEEPSQEETEEESTAPTVEEPAEENTQSTTESDTVDTVEEDISITEESEEASEEETVETSQDESNSELEVDSDTPEEESSNPTVEETTEENVESTTESETEEVAETDETIEDESVTEESEEATYKYDSETLTNELESKSTEERTAFIEENADNIEADEETLKELTQAVEDEHGVEIDENQVFSTMSTMSMSQAITDINSYIAENNFEVAEIQYDIIDHLPKYAYESNIGWEPENGKVGQPSGVVLHDVGNDNSTIHGEISYMSENWENAFVHAFVDADNIIQVANTDYLAYGAGPVSNEIHLQVELVRHDNQHDFAKSINNYADYIANLLYKYKLPAERADSSGNGTLWSHVEVSNILGGTASPDPYEYFQTHGYAYEDVISLIQGRYNNLYNKVTTPSIYMPTFEGDTSNLAGSITNQNRGIYESITDVKTADASNYLGEDVRVVRSEIYNYEEYYLLENVADGSTIGWMYAGDVATSALPETPVEDDDEGTDNSGDGSTPEAPVEDDNEGTDNSGDGSTPEVPEKENGEGTDNSGDGSTPEAPIEDDDEGTDNSDDGSTPEAPVEDDDEGADNSDDGSTPEAPVEDDDEGADNSGDDSNEDTSTDENQTDDGSDDSSEVESPSESKHDNGSGDESRNDLTEDNTSEDSVEDESEQPSNGDNESDDEAEEVVGRDESTDIDDDNGEATDDISSSLEDPETGIRVYSASNELFGKQLEVTVLNPSNAIDATHDLYDIHILNSDGSLYNLNNPVTVYLPANGYVSNLYYLGDIGETLEAISYRTDDDYVVFETSSFSQYAVVYGESNKENTIIPPTSEKHGGDSTDGSNTHSKVYTENVGQVDQAEETTSTNEATGNTQKDSNQKLETTDHQDEKVAVLPNTGVKEQGTTVFAALLAALGLGFLVRRRKSGEEK